MTYIVLLRGINVSGKHKIIMKDFVKTLQDLPEFLTVKSYIQSGNFIVNSSLENPKKVSEMMHQIIKEIYDYNVAVFSFTIDDFKAIIDAHPYEISDKRNYVAFINEQPAAENIEKLNSKDFGEDAYKIDELAIHLKFGQQYSKSKLNNNYLEQQLKITSTMRNWNTVQKLMSLAE